MGQCLACLRGAKDKNEGDKRTSKYTPLKEDEQEEEIDESIKQRRFTYTEKRKEIVRNDTPAPRSASVSSINKPKPSVPAKPTKQKSIDEVSVLSSDREALVPSKPSSEADSESIKSDEKVKLEIKPVPEVKPVVKEKPVTKEKPAVIERPTVPEGSEIVEKPVVTKKPSVTPVIPAVSEKEVAPEKEAEPEKALEPVAEVKPQVDTEPEKKAELDGKAEPVKEVDSEEVAEPVEEDVQEKPKDEEKPAEEKEISEEAKEVPANEKNDEEKPEVLEVDAGVELTNGETTSSMDFNVMADTAALTSITKSRVRGPKKKQRPTKSLAITTLDPFEVAAASDRNEQNGAPEPPTPEPEIKPKPKKTYGKPMIPMMGMGAMNSELMNKLGGRKKPSSPEPKPESPEPSAEPSEESPAPKKSPYRPPGARAMPGMGFGMGGGLGSELAGKLKSRNKAADSEDKSAESDDKPSPPVVKAKPKGGISIFPKPDASRPRSPGSLGGRKTPETPEKPALRTKSWGKQS